MPRFRIKKGDVVEKAVPLLLLRTSSRVPPYEEEFYNFCQVCGSDLSLHDTASLVNKILDNVTVSNLRTLSRQKTTALLCFCSKCGDTKVRYCSQHCRALGEAYAIHIHHLTCRRSNISAFQEYGRHIQSQIQTCLLSNDSQELFVWHCILTASLVILSNIQQNNATDGKMKEGNNHVSVEYPTGLQDFFLHAVTASSSQSQCRDPRMMKVPAVVEEMWSFFSACLQNSFPEAHILTSSSSSSSFFFATYHLVSQCLHRISLSDLATKFISGHILSLPPTDLRKSLKGLKPYITAAFRNDGTMPLNNPLEKDEIVSLNIIQYREAARVAQAASDDFDGESPFFSRRHEFFALCSPLEGFAFDSLPHSCVPTCILEGGREVDDEREKVNETDNSILKTGRVKVELFALHNIEKGDTLSVSRISNVEQELSHRTKALKEVLGPSFCCTCVRCCFEQQSPNAACNLSVLELKRIGDFAMQHSRFLDAIKAYNATLDIIFKKGNQTNDFIGEILHAKCAAYLGLDEFLTAQRLWRDAIKLCPSHEGIALEVRKQEAYNTSATLSTREEKIKRRKVGDNSISHDKVLPEFFTLIAGECYVTKNNHPVASKQECQQAIEWAESYAKSAAGWTTSRHYAVPTTDLPLHDIPPLLRWFNRIMESSIRPLLARQFKAEEVGIDGCNLHVHDAFVVRYNASEQRHLPLHQDESTHSFTLALNDNFKGGGTYIAKLGKSIKPSLGGLLSFRGNRLLHGGDVVVEGTRYIIAAFCYASKPKESNLHGSIGRSKLSSTFSEDSSGNTFYFSFQNHI